MTDEKELEDYIRTQKSLGVSEAAIRKSLAEAGYTHDEFNHLLARHAKKTSWHMPASLSIKHVLMINIMTIIVFGAMFAYFTYDYNTKMNTLASQQQELESGVEQKLSSQEQALSGKIDSQTGELDSEISVMQARIENVRDDLSSSIQSYNSQAMGRDSALSASIQRISNQSLSELFSFSQQLDAFRQQSVDFSSIIPTAIKSVVTIGKKGPGYFTSAGSGVFINNKGYLVTNYHVIDELGQITVRTHDETEYSATVIGKDEDWDIAVLKLITDKDDFTYLEFGDSDSVNVGTHVIAVGNPVGFESTVTQGIISSTDRLINGIDRSYFQTDVAINAGNSGGPLIDKNGKIIGIATLKYSGTGFEGLSFALKSDDVRRIVHDILEKEE